MKLFGLEFKINGFDIWHKGNLTKVSQLSNDAGYVTASNHSHSNINSRGDVTAETGNTRPAVNGVSMGQVYRNGYPIPYGNVLTLKGAGDTQLLLGWSGTSGAHADNYIRSRRDVADANWSSWAKIWTSANFDPNTKADKTEIPTKLSQLQNDIGAGGGVKITTSPTAPSNPSPGDFWYKEV